MSVPGSRPGDRQRIGSADPRRVRADPIAGRKPKACKVTELTGSNLRHARPGAGRALVGNGETGRVQSQRNQPVTGIATGRRIGGYDYKTESFQGPRAGNTRTFAKWENEIFFGVCKTN